MKHYKTNIAQAELADIEMYSVSATNENLQNVANLFERGITPAPVTRTSRPRILRVALTAALSVVMLFSVGLAASAEFREMFLGIFTATSTENVDDGLALDRFIIFEETVADNQKIYVLDDIIFKLNTDTWKHDACYAYRNGGIVEIEEVDINAMIEKAVEINGESYYFGQNVLPSHVEWKGLNTEFTEFINPHTDETIILDGYVNSIVISPNGEWIAYEKIFDYINSELNVYNTQTEKTFSTGMVTSTISEEIIMQSLSWLADGVLALIEGEVYFDENNYGEVSSFGRSQLYVFRIEERFLSAQ